jgi:uncharacterized protein involved in exopolysaccharide biosynthesis
MNNIDTYTSRNAGIRDELPSRRDVLRVLFRHKQKVIGFFLGAVFLTLIATLLVTPTFESDSKLLIKVGRESVSMDPSVLGPTMDLFQDRANEINSEIDILTSAFLVERVINEIGVAQYLDSDEFASGDDVEAIERAVSHFKRQLSVNSDPNSNIISLTFRARDPNLAQDSLATLIRSYLDRHIEIHSTQASPQFFEQRSTDLLNKLTNTEDRLEIFRKENKIASIDVQKDALITQISGLEVALNDTNSQVSASDARIVALQGSIDARPEVTELSRVTGIQNPAADNIKTRLIDLRFKETDLAARYPDDERSLVDVRQQIAVALAELGKEDATRSEITTGRDQNNQALRLDLITERSNLYAGMATLRSLTDELTAKRSVLNDLAGKEMELARLQRTVDIADLEYREYIAHYQRADISAALDTDKVSNVSVVQPASYSSDPIAPRKFLNMLLSLFIGLFGGVAIAYLAELLDDSLKTEADVASRLGLPVLTTLSTKEFQSCT